MQANVIKWDEVANRWQGGGEDVSITRHDRYADLPNPTLTASGTLALVIRDPREALNGVHVAYGNAALASYWQKV